MCKSQAEGGQRCAAHTRGPYQRATMSDPNWDDVARNYASTPEGSTALQHAADEAARTGNVEAEARLRTALTRGRSLRDTNTTLARLHKTTDPTDTAPAPPTAPTIRYVGSATHESAPLRGAATRDPMLTNPDGPDFDARFGEDVKRFEAGGKHFRVLHDSTTGTDEYVSVRQRSGKYKVVGYLRTYSTGEVSAVYVDDTYRRMGLSNQMREHLREKGRLVRHSRAISTDGAAWANTDPDDPDYLTDETHAVVTAAGLDPDRALVQRYGAGHRIWYTPDAVASGDKIPTYTSNGRVWVGSSNNPSVPTEMREVQSIEHTGSRIMALTADGHSVSLGTKPLVMSDTA
jgi:GNAT superfamily N-acetyltransferase